MDYIRQAPPFVSAFLVTTYLQDSQYKSESATSVDWAGIGLMAEGKVTPSPY